MTTDANGEYNISGLAEGSYYVQASGWAEVNGNWELVYISEYYLESPDREGATVVDVTGDVTGIDFTLEEGGKISGIVTDESGNPIEGAWVWANNYDGSGGGGVNTQPDGTYRITGLRSRDYRVDVNVEGQCAGCAVFCARRSVPSSITGWGRRAPRQSDGRAALNPGLCLTAPQSSL